MLVTVTQRTQSRAEKLAAAFGWNDEKRLPVGEFGPAVEASQLQAELIAAAVGDSLLTTPFWSRAGQYLDPFGRLHTCLAHRSLIEGIRTGTPLSIARAYFQEEAGRASRTLGTDGVKLLADELISATVAETAYRRRIAALKRKRNKQQRQEKKRNRKRP